MNNLQNLFRYISKPNIYNILTFATHERYETQLSKTGHNFFSFNRSGRKRWNKEQTPVPDNYFIMPENRLMQSIPYDIILVQSRFDDQFSLAKKIQQSLNIPIIVLEHSLPPVNVNDKIMGIMKTMSGDVNVFISDFSMEKWQIDSPNNIVIHHGIDTDTFKPSDITKEKHVLTVANKFAERPDLHFSTWLEIVQGIDNKVVGDNPGLSQSASNIEELVLEYNKCAVYINTSRTPIPMSLLEAMSCGCAVITVKDSMMVDIIEHGENGFITNDIEEIKSFTKTLFDDETLRNKLGQNARKTILSHFSQANFIDQWNSIFQQVYEGHNNEFTLNV